MGVEIKRRQGSRLNLEQQIAHHTVVVLCHVMEVTFHIAEVIFHMVEVLFHTVYVLFHVVEDFDVDDLIHLAVILRILMWNIWVWTVGMWKIYSMLWKCYS